MDALLAIAFLVGLFILWQTLKNLWQEWSGALHRRSRGEPLRFSEWQSLQWQAEREAREAKEKAAEERRVLRRAERRQRHDSYPRHILDPHFRREFEDLGIAAAIRQEVIEAYDYRCAGCRRQFSQHRRKPLLHVDHIKPRSLYPHLLYVKSNLQVLCRSCNVHKHDYDGADWKVVVAARRRATKKRHAARKGPSGPI